MTEANPHKHKRKSPPFLLHAVIGIVVILTVIVFVWLPYVQIRALYAREMARQNAIVVQRAIIEYDRYESTALSNITDSNGRSLLSWRVRLLPRLGYPELYNRFRLDEPWDSTHNLSLLRDIPSVYSLHSASHSGYSSISYHYFRPGYGLYGAVECDNALDSPAVIVVISDWHESLWTKPDTASIQSLVSNVRSTGQPHFIGAAYCIQFIEEDAMIDAIFQGSPSDSFKNYD